MDNGATAKRIVGLALSQPVGREWKGYWQLYCGANTPHVRFLFSLTLEANRLACYILCAGRRRTNPKLPSGGSIRCDVNQGPGARIFLSVEA